MIIFYFFKLTNFTNNVLHEVIALKLRIFRDFLFC